MAAEWPEPEKTSGELQWEKNVAKLEVMPNGALVASRGHRQALRLARFALSVSMPQLRGASKLT